MSEPSEIQTWLRDGIAAARQGKNAEAQAHLLRVVGADPRNEPAWLWLATVLDSAADRLEALEQVVQLNPHNTAAQARLTQLKQELGLALPPAAPSQPPPPPEPEPQRPPPAPPEPACVYCGFPTPATLTRCPQCRRSLLILKKWPGRGVYQYLLLLLTGLQAQVALMLWLGASFNLAAANGFDPFVIKLVQSVPTLGDLIFAVRNPSAELAMTLFLASLTRAIVLMVLAWLFYSDLDWAYAAGIGLPLADMGWNLYALNVLGWTNPLLVKLNGAFSAIILLIALGGLLNRRGARTREFIELDRTATNAVGLYLAGRNYARQGKWAGAAVHWSKAAALKPSEAQYTKDLALALIRLGRMDEARDALHRGAEHHPADPDFPALLRSLKQP